MTGEGGLMKTKDILNAASCENKGILSKLGFYNEKGEKYYLSIAVKNVIKKCLESGDSTNIREMLSEELKYASFLFDMTKSETVEFYYRYIVRFMRWVDENVISYKVSPIGTVTIGGIDILVAADFIFSTAEGTFTVKIKTSSPTLSPNGRSAKTRIDCNLEVFLLAKLGETIIPMSKNAVHGGFFHLKSKDDS